MFDVTQTKTASTMTRFILCAIFTEFTTNHYCFAFHCLQGETTGSTGLVLFRQQVARKFSLFEGKTKWIATVSAFSANFPELKLPTPVFNLTFHQLFCVPNLKQGQSWQAVGVFFSGNVFCTRVNKLLGTCGTWMISTTTRDILPCGFTDSAFCRAAQNKAKLNGKLF